MAEWPCASSSTVTVWICNLPGPKIRTWDTQIVVTKITESSGHGTRQHFRVGSLPCRIRHGVLRQIG